MKLLCKTQSFIEILSELESLLSDEYLNKKGIKEKIDGIEKLKKFLNCILTLFEKEKISSYESLMALLEREKVFKCRELDRETIGRFLGYIGKLIDAVQVLKPYTDRHKKIEDFLVKALSRTGHRYVFDCYKSQHEEELNFILNEIRRTVAASIMLEIVTRIYTDGSNPITSLRKNMKDRYAEEYFSEMVAGWMAEKYFQELLQESFSIKRAGVDKDFNIFLKKPSRMGEVDFIVDGRKIELQRSSIEKFEIKEDKKIVRIKTPLKEHKLKNADGIIFWIGNAKVILQKECKRSFFWFMKINPLLSLFSIKGRGQSFFTDIPAVSKRNSPKGYAKAYDVTVKLNEKIDEILRLLKGHRALWLLDNVLNVLSEEKRQKYMNSYDIRNRLEAFKIEYNKKGSRQNKRVYLINKLRDLEELQKELDELFKILVESQDIIEKGNEKIKLHFKDEQITIEMEQERFIELLLCEEEIVKKSRDVLL